MSQKIIKKIVTNIFSPNYYALHVENNTVLCESINNTKFG